MRRQVLVALLALMLTGATAISAEANGPPSGGATRAEAICLDQGGTFFANTIFMVSEPGPGFFCSFSHDSSDTLPDPSSVLSQPFLRGVAARCSAAGGQYSTFVKTLDNVLDYFIWGCDLR